MCPAAANKSGAMYTYLEKYRVVGQMFLLGRLSTGSYWGRLSTSSYWAVCPLAPTRPSVHWLLLGCLATGTHVMTMIQHMPK